MRNRQPAGTSPSKVFVYHSNEWMMVEDLTCLDESEYNRLTGRFCSRASICPAIFPAMAVIRRNRLSAACRRRHPEP